MKKTIKILLGFIGAVVLVAAAGVIFVTLIVDPNDYKADISSLVEKQTGRHLNISGGLELTFFPWLGVRTGRLDLSNPPDFDEASMLTVKQAEMRVKLLPLLKQELEVDTIVLVEPVVHLIVAADGESNWQDLSGQDSPDPSEPAGALGALAIQGIDLTGGKLIWEDRQAGSTYVFSDVGLATGEILSEQPARVELRFVYVSKDLDYPVAMNLDSTVRVDLGKELVEVTDSVVHGDYGPTASADIKFGALRVDLARSTVESEALDLSAKYTAEGLEPMDINIGSSLKLDLANNRVEFENAVGQAVYGAAGSAALRFSSLKYDIGRGAADVEKLELDGKYDGPGLAEAVTANLSAGLTADLNDGVLVFEQGVARTGYGSSASTDARFDSLQYDMNHSTIDVQNLDMDGTYAAADLAAPIAAKIKTGLSVTLPSGVVELARATVQIAYGTLANADIEAQTLRYDQSKAAIAATALKLDGKYEAHEIQTVFPTLSANMDKQQAAMPGFTAVVDGVESNVDLEVAEFLGNLKYSGKLSTKAFKPADLLERFDLAFDRRDPSALTGAKLSTAFKGGLDGIKLDNLSLQLDDTQAVGFLEIERFEEPKVRFDISIDDVDIDRYAPANGEPAETGAAIVVLPVGLFRQLDANGQLKVARLKVSGVKMSDIVVGVASAAGGMTVEPMNASLYGGTMQGEMRFAEDSDTAVLTVRQVMEQVDIGPLLVDTGVTDRFTGTGRLALDIRAEEVNGRPKTEGTADFRFYDGAVKGLDLRKIYLQARQIYNQQRGKEQAVATDDREEFRFTEMTGTLVFDEMSARNDDLQIKSPLFRINGLGNADLAANQLDYLVNATIVESAKGQGGEELSDLKGVTLPIRITGALNAPDYQLDVGKLLQGVVQERVDQETQKLEKKLEKKLGEELQKLFKIN